MNYRQRTIKNEVGMSGRGLQTGKKVAIVLRPAPVNTGIVFRRVDLKGKPCVEAIPANVLEETSYRRRTVIKKGAAEVHTAEHLLAALSGFAIDNIVIDIDSIELPGLDGSARDFVKALQDAGFDEQPAAKKVIEIKEPIICEIGSSSINAAPACEFKIDYFLEFAHPRPKEENFSITVDTSGVFNKFFQNELAPSRTFCSATEALGARLTGLGKGANFKNTLVMWRRKPLFNHLRFPDEISRHKVLDLLGDLYLLGGHIKGRIIARKSGHSLNAIFVKELALRNSAPAPQPREERSQ